MLMEELFSRGVMTMGPSRSDPARQVGVFGPEAVAQHSAIRAAEMEKFRWIAGGWNYQNRVPATRCNPAYTDIGSCRYEFCEKETWICLVGADGREIEQITFDPYSRQWIYVLTGGAYGMLRSREGWVQDRIVFSGLMTMLGIDCQWRITFRKESDEAFGVVNEELGPDGTWQYIDEWCFKRK